MRLFIAIDIPKQVKEEIKKIQKKIENLGKINLVKTENIHITLKFLGEVEEHKKEDIIKKLKRVEFESFSLVTSNIGLFPNEKFIRVIWAGFENDEKLRELQKNLNDALKESFRPEKNFQAHTTIARVKFIPFENKKELLRIIKGTKIKKIEFEVNSFKLMKSTLTEKGPIYADLEKFSPKSL